MFSMEPRTDLIHFEHNGVKYAMTREEINAAYAYKDREYQEEDALRQLDYFVFGYENPDFGDNPEDAGPGEAEDLAAFEEKYEISYMEARKLKTHFVARFNSTASCGTAENDIWHNAIEAVLNEVKERKRAQS